MREVTIYVFFLLSGLVRSSLSQSRGYQRILGESALRKYCSEDGEECMFSTHCCPGLQCAIQGNIGTCLSHKSALRKCLTDADCPETMCCHRTRRRGGGFGACAYVCDGRSSIFGDHGGAKPLVEGPDNEDVPVGSYRGDDFWNYWEGKRYFTAPMQRYMQRGF